MWMQNVSSHVCGNETERFKGDLVTSAADFVGTKAGNFKTKHDNFPTLTVTISTA